MPSLVLLPEQPLISPVVHISGAAGSWLHEVPSSSQFLSDPLYSRNCSKSWGLPLSGISKVEAMTTPESFSVVQGGDTTAATWAEKPRSVAAKVNCCFADRYSLLKSLPVDCVCKPDAVFVAVDSDLGAV